VIVPLQSTVYIDIYVNLFAGIRSSKFEPEYKTVFKTSQEEPNRFNYNVDEMVRTNSVRWLIAVPPRDKEENIYPQCIAKLNQLQKEFSDLRIVIVDREINDSQFFNIVQDRKAGLELIIRKSLEVNAKKILFFDSAVGAKKEFRKYLSKCASLLPSEVILDIKCRTEAKKDYNKILKKGYDTVFCDSDYYARRLLNIADGEIPFRLVGYNGTAIAQSCSPSIATINSNLAEAGKIAVEYLFNRKKINNKQIKVTPFFMNGDSF
jgi:DNA-binding LacI/PurR family transcriptional regulator